MDEENNPTKDEERQEHHEEKSESRDEIFKEPSTKSKSTIWKPIAIIMTVLFIISIGAYVFVPSAGMATGGALSEAAATDTAVTYVSENLVSPDVAVNVTEIARQGNFYKITIGLTADENRTAFPDDIEMYQGVMHQIAEMLSEYFNTPKIKFNFSHGFGNVEVDGTRYAGALKYQRER